jgi:hypothetical protein
LNATPRISLLFNSGIELSHNKPSAKRIALWLLLMFTVFAGASKSGLRRVIPCETLASKGSSRRFCRFHGPGFVWNDRTRVRNCQASPETQFPVFNGGEFSVAMADFGGCALANETAVADATARSAFPDRFLFHPIDHARML